MITRIDQIVQPSDWQTALKNTINDLKSLCEYVDIPYSAVETANSAHQLFPLKVPYHFAAQIEKGNINDPLLRQVILQTEELIQQPGYTTDPVMEHHTQIPGLVHKYKNRVLLILTRACAINCRYCFRRAFPYKQNNPGKHGWQQAFEYIRLHNITEVILSGGDPLIADDKQLAFFFQQLNSIDCVKRIRIHSRVPVVLPERITTNLVDILTESRSRICLVLHANHANELSEQVVKGVQRLARANIHLLNQSVLLKGVNDSTATLAALSEKLFEIGIQPYYLHMLDKVVGSHHFDVGELRAIELLDELRRQLPGYLVPQLVREIGGEPNKTPIFSNIFSE